MIGENNILKKWLDKLQEESWNLELLISGFSIFGLFKARDFLEIKSALLYANDIASNSFMAFLSVFFVVVYTSVNIFIVFLLLHIFFRGLWIGAIGIRYVSGEIEYDKFKSNPKITDYLKRKVGSFDDYILKLEKISSVIFGYTFLIILVLLSVCLFFVFTALASIYTDKLLANTAFEIIGYAILPIVLLGIGFFAVIDFFTAGILKRIKNKILVKIYIICNVFVSWITLSFLWKPLYYNLADKKSTKWFIYFMIPLFGLIVLQDTFSYSSFSIFPKKFTSDGRSKYNSISFKEKARFSFQSIFYDNLRNENETIEVMSLQNHKINIKSMELFVKLYNYDERLLMRLDTTIKPIAAKGFTSHLIKKSEYEEEMLLRKENEEKIDRSYFNKEQKLYRQSLDKILQAAKKLYSVKINDVAIHKDSIDILFHKHQNKNEEGFLLLFPATNIEKGMNLITLEKLEYNLTAKDYDTVDFTIPFVYEIN